MTERCPYLIRRLGILVGTMLRIVRVPGSVDAEHCPFNQKHKTTYKVPLV